MSTFSMQSGARNEDRTGVPGFSADERDWFIPALLDFVQLTS